MNLPEFDISSLPGLDTLTGMFGSLLQAKQDDSLVILMTYVYEVMPPAGP